MVSQEGREEAMTSFSVTVCQGWYILCHLILVQQVILLLWEASHFSSWTMPFPLRVGDYLGPVCEESRDVVTLGPQRLKASVSRQGAPSVGA